LSWRRNQLLDLHFLERFLLIASLGLRKLSKYFYLVTVLQFPSCGNSSEFPNFLESYYVPLPT
jgi:hypothetical protein